MGTENTSSEQQLADQFKEGLDQAGAVALAAHAAQLEGDLAAANELVEGANQKAIEDKAAIDAMSAEHDTLQAQFDMVSAESVSLEARVEAVTRERDQALDRATAAESAAADALKAQKAVKSSVARVEHAGKLRKLGPIDSGLTGDALSQALADADKSEKKIEIVLSDGKREIAGIAPIAVSGDVWREHSLGKMLRDPVEIHGPQQGASPYRIDGYALLIDGKQVAYTKRADVISIGAGQTSSIVDDIYF